MQTIEAVVNVDFWATVRSIVGDVVGDAVGDVLGALVRDVVEG